MGCSVCLQSGYPSHIWAVKKLRFLWTSFSTCTAIADRTGTSRQWGRLLSILALYLILTKQRPDISGDDVRDRMKVCISASKSVWTFCKLTLASNALKSHLSKVIAMFIRPPYWSSKCNARSLVSWAQMRNRDMKIYWSSNKKSKKRLRAVWALLSQVSHWREERDKRGSTSKERREVIFPTLPYFPSSTLSSLSRNKTSSH